MKPGYDDGGDQTPERNQPSKNGCNYRQESKLDWQKIKEEIYYWDGSLRDIYVVGTTKGDWKKWVDFVNENYRVSFTEYDTETVYDKIAWTIIEERFAGNYDLAYRASFDVGDIILNTFFFTEEQIENDITPSEITTLEAHEQLMNYMQAVASLLNKPVRLSNENHPEQILIEVLPYSL